MKKKIIAVGLAAMMTLSGCGEFVNENVEAYPLAGMMTNAEVVDYYAKSLNYDAVVSRNVTVHKAQYEMRDVPSQKAELLKNLVSETQEVLKKDDYEDNKINRKLISKNTYGYIKSVIDDMTLSNASVNQIKGALGYYFVDVDYDITPSPIGKFKDNVYLAGLRGAFKLNVKEEYEIDSDFLKAAAKKLDEYFYENEIKSHAVYNESKKTLEIKEGVEPEVDEVVKSTKGKNRSDRAGNVEGKDKDKSKDVKEDTRQIDFKVKTDKDGYTVFTPESRRIKSDIPLINKVVGGRNTVSTMMPYLNNIFEKPKGQGIMSGYGIYDSGSSALKQFGYNRNQYSGKLTLRYVFRDDSDGTGEILGSNIYCTKYNINNGVNVTTSNVLVPEFLFSKLNQLIDRADRAQVDYNFSALMAGGLKSGIIYEDIGAAILRGYKEENVGITKYMSKISQIISRNTQENLYLLDVETTITEGPKDIDRYGTYKDRYYIVAQQQNSNFAIIDLVRVSREMVTEPQIDPDSNTHKKLVALNLAGQIGDNAKEAIKSLMGEFYTAGTNRIARGPKEITVGDQNITINKGVYDCFTSDETVLSSDDLEYATSKLLNQLTKYGSDVKSLYNGLVTEWIGGYDNQAEFTTEEFIYYPSKGTGHYMKVYYLVSVNNDSWVIDERTILDENLIDDESTVNNICERLGIER